MKLQRLITSALAITMLATPVTASASQTGVHSSVPVEANVAVATFKVSVPSVLPIHINSSRQVTTSSDATISNQSAGPVQVSSVTFEALHGWEVIPFLTDINSLKVGKEQIGFQLNGLNTTSSGKIEFNEEAFAPISAGGTQALEYDAIANTKTSGAQDEVVAQVVFTLDWSTSSNDYTYNDFGSWVGVGDKLYTTFDYTGEHTVTPVYTSSNPSIATVASDYTCDVGTAGHYHAQVISGISAGTAILTADFKNGDTVNVTVNVMEKAQSYKILRMPKKLQYTDGERLDFTGILVELQLSDGSTIQINDTGVGSLKYSAYKGQTSMRTKALYPGYMAEIEVPITVWDGTEPSVGAWVSLGEFKYQLTAKGWRVHLIDNTKSEYRSPEETVLGIPVSSLEETFMMHASPELTLIDWRTHNITSMRNTFYNCQATTLDISSLDTENVILFIGTFEATSADVLDLRNFNTSKATNMTKMFHRNTSSEIYLSSLDTSNVTDMTHMFNYCRLTELDISNFDFTNTTRMGDMFRDSYSLKKVYVGTGEHTSKLWALPSNTPWGMEFVVK